MNLFEAHLDKLEVRTHGLTGGGSPKDGAIRDVSEEEIYTYIHIEVRLHIQ